MTNWKHNKEERDMDKEVANQLAKGLNNIGSHIGSGLAWLGFWIFLGMCMIEVVPVINNLQ